MVAQWLKLQDLHVAPPLSEPLKKAGVRSDPLTKWQMLSLQSRQFVWHDKDDFSMSLISDLSGSKRPKSYPIEATKAACFMFELVRMTAFNTGGVPMWVCD